ncbi:MAG: alanyl-tRNA editing protein [Candidatus Nanohaloarchaeota archaeon QJJ-5]|nr:alanyl-tRNA editing protein [Candidatus Nanohaloarchaeota archaeon QJJ-5]
MTERIYMEDCYAETVSTQVEAIRAGGIVLSETVFYPEGGGQPADQGVINVGGTSIQVTDVSVDHGEILHHVESTDPITEGDDVDARIDWERRHMLMRMHTAQHLLSAVVLDMFDAKTVGNQIHPSYSRIDFEPVNFSQKDLDRIERRCNALIEEERSVSIYEEDRETVVEKLPVGRSNLDLIPDHIDPLRVVEIEGLDICPCGGTHVSNLDEIGRFIIEDRKSKGEDIDRIEFSLDA